MSSTDRPYFGPDKPEYGTVEYYKEYFSDVLCDAASGDELEDQIEASMKILEGFKQAIESWFHYHRTSAITYEDLLNHFLNQHFIDDRIQQEILDQEELALPTIPEFPSLIKPGLTD